MKKFGKLTLILVLAFGFIAGEYFFYKNINQQKITNNVENKITPTEQAIVPTPTPTPVQTEFKLLFVGDTMLARSVGERIKNGIDPFELIMPTFKNYDAIIANLETTVSNQGDKLIGKAYNFRAPIESIDYIKNANIKAVSLANNHTKDYGDAALLDTIERLKAGGILPFGAGATPDEAFSGKVLQIKDLKIGLLAFNEIENRITVNKNGPTSAWTDLPRLKSEIEKLKLICDIVIVQPHWGTEYSKSVNNWQTKLGHLLIDYGADIVIGGHPHVVEPSELYNGKMVYYSMGNFVFDQMQGISGATDGEMIELIVRDRKISQSNSLKIKITKDGRPQISPQ